MYYVLAVFTGFILGIGVMALCTMAKKGEKINHRAIDYHEGYEAGYEDGWRRKQGKECLKMVPSRGGE